MGSVFAICFAVLSAACSVHAAQRGAAEDPAPGYPVRPIRLMVPFPPGGSNDIMARYFARYLTERFGRQVVMNNRAGADGIIGTEIVARSHPDGHTLLLVSAAFAVNAATRKLLRSAQVIRLGGDTGIRPERARGRSGAQGQLGEGIICPRRANPGQLTLATSGECALCLGVVQPPLRDEDAGSGLQGWISRAAGRHGRAGARQSGSLIQTLPHFKSGKLTPLATSGAKRATAAPDLPTIAEAGLAGYEANNWWAIAAPAGTPAGVIVKLNAEMARYLDLPETKKRFVAEGAETDPRTPAKCER